MTLHGFYGQGTFLPPRPAFTSGGLFLTWEAAPTSCLEMLPNLDRFFSPPYSNTEILHPHTMPDPPPTPSPPLSPPLLSPYTLPPPPSSTPRFYLYHLPLLATLYTSFSPSLVPPPLSPPSFLVSYPPLCSPPPPSLPPLFPPSLPYPVPSPLLFPSASLSSLTILPSSPLSTISIPPSRLPLSASPPPLNGFCLLDGARYLPCSFGPVPPFLAAPRPVKTSNATTSPPNGCSPLFSTSRSPQRLRYAHYSAFRPSFAKTPRLSPKIQFLKEVHFFFFEGVSAFFPSAPLVFSAASRPSVLFLLGFPAAVARFSFFLRHLAPSCDCFLFRRGRLSFFFSSPSLSPAPPFRVRGVFLLLLVPPLFSLPHPALHSDVFPPAACGCPPYFLLLKSSVRAHFCFVHFSCPAFARLSLLFPSWTFPGRKRRTVFHRPLLLPH